LSRTVVTRRWSADLPVPALPHSWHERWTVQSSCEERFSVRTASSCRL
jgi:hypothetical protein